MQRNDGSSVGAESIEAIVADVDGDDVARGLGESYVVTEHETQSDTEGRRLGRVHKFDVGRGMSKFVPDRSPVEA
ncbi:MAG: hypothetical protein ACHRXM_01985 [Isosphaerales bacterium]